MGYINSMDDLPAGNDFRPAKGLKKLTWSQVEKIDEVIDLMSSLSRKMGSEIEIVITIKNGHPRFVKHPLVSYELRPGRE